VLTLPKMKSIVRTYSVPTGEGQPVPFIFTEPDLPDIQCLYSPADAEADEGEYFYWSIERQPVHETVVRLLIAPYKYPVK
jgi:hypothetical protein